jgi:hypothetical protein
MIATAMISVLILNLGSLIAHSIRPTRPSREPTRGYLMPGIRTG